MEHQNTDAGSTVEGAKNVLSSGIAPIAPTDHRVVSWHKNDFDASVLLIAKRLVGI